MKISVLIAATAAIIGTASMAIAGSSTSYNWSFDTDASPATSSLSTATATIAVDEEFGTGWWDSMPELYGSAQGWWDIARGSITLDVPNASSEAQNIQIGITYWKDMSQAPDVQFTSASFVSKTTSLIEAGELGGGWYTDVWNWYLAPNMDPSTSISIFGAQNSNPEEMSFGSQIDQISVNAASVTAAVPEPGSLVALCSGLIGVFGCAFRRKRA